MYTDILVFIYPSYKFFYYHCVQLKKHSTEYELAFGLLYQVNLKNYQIKVKVNQTT